MKVRSKTDEVKKFLAINEVSILRQSRQAAFLSVKEEKNLLVKN